MKTHHYQALAYPPEQGAGAVIVTPEMWFDDSIKWRRKKRLLFIERSNFLLAEVPVNETIDVDKWQWDLQRTRKRHKLHGGHHTSNFEPRDFAEVINAQYHAEIVVPPQTIDIVVDPQTIDIVAPEEMTVLKGPNEVRRYRFNFNNIKEVEDRGESIASIVTEPTVSNGETGLTLSSGSLSSNYVTFSATSGTLNKTYEIYIKVRTTGSNDIESYFSVRITKMSTA